MIAFWSDIQASAKAFNLDPRIIGGLVQVESGGNPWAWNPEPRYRYFWDVKTDKPFRAITSAELTSQFPPPDFHSVVGDPDNEWWAQQASWGLMQVMGAVARELGFTSPYLTELCDPTRNLVVGCKKLKHLMDWAHGESAKALAAYNGGEGNNQTAPYHNQAYADKVLHTASVLDV